LSWTTKRFRFNEEMDKDFEQIRGMFKQTFGLEPSNTEVQKFLLKIFKENNYKIRRMPRSNEYRIF